eukprot:5509969-Pyramimonas_sp.AAC.1
MVIGGINISPGSWNAIASKSVPMSIDRSSSSIELRPHRMAAIDSPPPSSRESSNASFVLSSR